MMKKLHTPETICEFLGIEKTTLYSWTSKGIIPFVKVNGLLRFRENEIEKWLKLRERGIIISRIEEILKGIQKSKENGKTL